ncbi:RYamide receptor-like [Lingula anatina]|uniref:RYamide receptor-like n=1 Tax=Lingula anatina TaxID=7574 RepID=A0A1S3IXU9_LINAN|nr:RYamide receptor-like [Lingula anatina]|eukprot:XP_013402806.1 RYamide receptor-like [Lingula anatina]
MAVHIHGYSQNFSRNESGFAFVENPRLQPGIQALLIILYGLITLFGVGGNLTVCYIVVSNKRMRTVTNYFIVNLAISDIIMALLCIPMTFVASVLLQSWPFGDDLCRFVTYIQTVAVFLSAFTLVAISLDRYVAILYPLRPKPTKRAAMFAIAVVWALAFITPLPTAILSKVDEYLSCREMWKTDQQRFHYSVAIMVLQYFLPLLALVITYARIAIAIWVKRPPGEAENKRDQRLAASKRKMVKTMITVVGVYTFCWLPIHSVTIALDLHPELHGYYIFVIWIICHWLAMSNSCVNPIIYCWMNPKYQRGFLYAFRWLPCIRNKAIPTPAVKFTSTFRTSLRTVSVKSNSSRNENGRFSNYRIRYFRETGRKTSPKEIEFNKVACREDVVNDTDIVQSKEDTSSHQQEESFSSCVDHECVEDSRR